LKKILLRSFLVIFLIALIYAVIVAWGALPIISGYGSKALCSCVFLSGRDATDVIKKELGDMPLSLGTFSIDMKDSSATGSVFGFAKRKAIYRNGLGCTITNGISEEELRSQKFYIMPPAVSKTDSILWPAGDVIEKKTMFGIDYQMLQKTVNEAFENPSGKLQRHLRAVVVLYDGNIVVEKYAEGFNERKRHTGWSMAKSVINALVGILVQKKILRTEMHHVLLNGTMMREKI
jgi:hypothetical protein